MEERKVLLNHKEFLDKDPHNAMMVSMGISVSEEVEEGDSWKPSLLNIEATLHITTEGGLTEFSIYLGGPADDAQHSAKELARYRAIMYKVADQVQTFADGLGQAEEWLKEKRVDAPT